MKMYINLMRSEPLFVDNVIPDRFRPESVLKFFQETVLK